VLDEMMVIGIENYLYQYHYLYSISLLDGANNVNPKFLMSVKMLLWEYYFDEMMVLVMDDKFDFDE
jgi:hypothetical protein